MAFSAERQGVTLECSVAPDLPAQLIGDTVRLRQILVNLIGNAIKFTSKGEIRVTVAAEEITGKHATLRFSVRDTGIGISPEKVDRLFQPFEQADASTSRKYGGTGLGLAISARLVELMGGQIWVESTLGAGSTFHFTALFPIGWNVGEAKAQHADLGNAVLLGSGKTESPARILLAEDNAVNQKLAMALLERMGHEVWLARNGIEAVQQWRMRSYDLILMDVQMPEMDGFEATRSIRSEESDSRPRTPIVAMTAYAMNGDRELCLAAGMDHYISKPISRYALEQAIERFCPREPIAEGCSDVTPVAK
jgi:CheY-like chemotaxis protein